jgi:hypothetical protein
MRKIIIFLSVLLISSALSANTNLNPKALATTVLNMHKLSYSNQASFNIIYGGEDVSNKHLISINPPELLA